MSRLHLAALIISNVVAQGVVASAQPGTPFHTVNIAGGGPPNGSAATSVALSFVQSVTTDGSGNVYVASLQQSRVFKIATNGTITTVAGSGTQGFSGDGGPAVSAQLSSPKGLAVDNAGNLYVADSNNNRIRKVSGGVITTVAGTGSFGSAGDNGPAVSAQVSQPFGVALDSTGNLFIADTGNCRIREVSGGIITTVAGNGNCGYGGDGLAATSGQISAPYAVAIGSTGTLYIADSNNSRIRAVLSGVITTVAGNGSYGYGGDGGVATSAQITYAEGIAVDGAGNFYFADTNNCRVRKVSGGVITSVIGNGSCTYSGDGALASSAGITPSGVAIDGAGTIYLSDGSNNRVRKVLNGVIFTIGGNGSFEYSGDSGLATNAQLNPAGIATDNAGNLYVADFQDYRVRHIAGGIITTAAGDGLFGYSGDGGLATNSAITSVSGVAVDNGGNLYIADTGNNRVRKISGGLIGTVAGNGSYGYSGDGGPATSAQFTSLQAVTTDNSGNIYVADNGRIRKIAGGVITLLAGGGPQSTALATDVSVTGLGAAVDSAGNLYVAAGPQNRVFAIAPSGVLTVVAGNGTVGFSGDNGLATAAQLTSPGGVAIDSTGALYIADTGNCRIRKVSGGIISTVAGGNGCGFAGDGGLATSAQINSPYGVAVDSSNKLYIADTDNNRIRQVSSGLITTLAGNGIQGYSGDGGQPVLAQLGFPEGIGFDSAGNLYIADTQNYRIRKISGGLITTVAGNGTFGYSGDGGLATNAQISNASDVAVDSLGNLYIADSNNSRIRKVSGGIITTVAGNGVFGYSGDGGPATSAEIASPAGIAVNPAGNLYIADTSNNRIRKVLSGVITTVAGNGFASYSGDGGPATNAQIGTVTSLAADSAGNLYLADRGNERVRVVSAGGTISTFAGGGTQGIANGILATGATLSGPSGLAAAGGNVYIEDGGLLREVTGGVINTIATVAGNGSFPFPGDGGLAVDSSGNIFLSEPSASLVVQIKPVAISFLSPASAVAAGPGFTLTVNGANFANGDTVLWNGTALSTSFVSNSQLQAAVGSALIATAVPVCVQVLVASNGLTGCLSFTIASSLCVYTLDQAPYHVQATGGTVSAVLTATAGCSWAVTNGYQGSVTIVSGGSGTGSATITLSVAPNPSSSARTFILSVGTTQIVIAQPGALQLVTLAPCRVMDTRNSSGPLGGPFIHGGTTRAIPIPSSTCGVPSNAVAYSLNITVVPRTGTLGYVSVWPAGQPQPVVSTLNSPDGAVLANAAIVPAGTGGAIDVYATNDTELIIDINGYFVPPAAGTLQFYPLTPCRILDTRNANGAFGGPALAGQTGRSVLVPSSGCGAPSGAAAYSLNLTVVPHGSLGYLTTWPTGQLQPLVSTLNSLDGTVLANAAIVPAGTNGAVSFFASDTTDLIADINGYFAPPGSGGLNFYTATPCRIVDTRNPSGAFGGPIMSGGSMRTFPLSQGSCGIPLAAAAYSLNVTVAPSGFLGYLAAWPAGGSQPVVSTLNAYDGQIVANAAIVPAGVSGSINVYVTNATHVILDATGYFGQ